jgi:hypothetical protein
MRDRIYEVTAKLREQLFNPAEITGDSGAGCSVTACGPAALLDPGGVEPAGSTGCSPSGHHGRHNRAAEFTLRICGWALTRRSGARRRAARGRQRVWIDTGDKRPNVDMVLPCAAPASHPNRHSAFAWGRSLAEGVGCAGNSGFAALNLAWILGADQIYLLGFDMKGEGGVRTFDSRKAPSDVLCDRWLESFRGQRRTSGLRERVVVLGWSMGTRGLIASRRDWRECSDGLGGRKAWREVWGAVRGIAPEAAGVRGRSTTCSVQDADDFSYDDELLVDAGIARRTSEHHPVHGLHSRYSDLATG